MSYKDNLSKIILFDNGSYEIKHSKANMQKTYKFHNAKFFNKTNYNNISSTIPFFIKDISTDLPKEQISSIGNNYQRPLSRGLLSDIDLQLDIWEKILSQHYGLNKDDDNIKQSLFMFTHIPMLPDEILGSYFEIIFEYFNFGACIKSIPHLFTSYYNKMKYNNINKTVQLVIDSGFSSTTIVPIFNNFPIYNAIKRVDISGKLLSNYLKIVLAILLN